jgi:hypothetical protein
MSGNDEKLREQVRQAGRGLRVDVLWHTEHCGRNPCRCDVRALVLATEPANTRTGYRTVRRIVRLGKDVPEPTPFTMSDSANQEPAAPEKPRDTAILWK